VRTDSRSLVLTPGMCAGGVISAEPRVHSSTEGGNVTVRCSLNAARRDRKFFYRTDQEETLVEAFGGRAASSRFSIQHDGGRTFSLTITGLKMSDSGRYRCGVGGPNAYNTSFILSRVGCLMVVVLFLIFLLLLYSWRMKKSHSRELLHH
uniref:Ig-like domain-containing protein n=1 Tax=Stegastes partitus TaxID=144197 RepID=A0A3B5B418_9TELE